MHFIQEFTYLDTWMKWHHIGRTFNVGTFDMARVFKRGGRGEMARVTGRYINNIDSVEAQYLASYMTKEYDLWGPLELWTVLQEAVTNKGRVRTIIEKIALVGIHEGEVAKMMLGTLAVAEELLGLME